MQIHSKKFYHRPVAIHLWLYRNGDHLPPLGVTLEITYHQPSGTRNYHTEENHHPPDHQTRLSHRISWSASKYEYMHESEKSIHIYVNMYILLSECTYLVHTCVCDDYVWQCMFGDKQE